MNGAMAFVPIPGSGAPGPATNLNIGMDYWGAPTSSAISGIRGKAAPTPVTGGTRDPVQPQLWLQVGFFALLFLRTDIVTNLTGSSYAECKITRSIRPEI